MLDLQKTINFYGRSLSNDETPIVLATMDASVSDSGDIRINKYVSSKEVYVESSEIINADFAEFETKVQEYALAEMTNSNN